MISNGNFEAGFIPAPYSTAEIREEQVVVVGREIVPSEIISTIVVNEQAKELLPASLQTICSQDYLSSVCSMTVPLESIDGGKDQAKILTPGRWGRTIPVGYGIIPIADRFIGGLIMGKGGNTSGKKYEQCHESMHPIGFFGHLDAQFEIDIGNLLLAYNFKAGLPLGYLVFDYEKLRKWLLYKWKGIPDLASNIEKNLTIVKDNKEEAVFFVRVSGVTERIEMPDFYSRRARRRRQTELVRACRLLNHEAQLFPDYFNKLLGGSFTLEETMETLGKITKRQNLNQRDLEVFLQIFLGTFAQNSIAIEKISSEKKLGDDYDYNSLARVLSCEKDIDFTGFTVDYEQAREAINDNDQKEPAENYLCHVKNMMGYFVKKELLSSILADFISKDYNSSGHFSYSYLEEKMLVARTRLRMQTKDEQ